MRGWGGGMPCPGFQNVRALVGDWAEAVPTATAAAAIAMEVRILDACFRESFIG